MQVERPDYASFMYICQAQPRLVKILFLLLFLHGPDASMNTYIGYSPYEVIYLFGDVSKERSNFQIAP